MRPAPAVRPPAGHDVERLFHTQAGPLTLRGPERVLEQVRVLPLPPRRPYDWQRDEAPTGILRIPEAIAEFNRGVVPAGQWQAEALAHLRDLPERRYLATVVGRSVQAVRPSIDPIEHGPEAIATAPLALVRMSVDLRATEALG